MAKKKKYNNVLESPGFVLWQVSNLWQKKVTTALETVGLSHVQFVLLAGLEGFSKNGEEVTQTRLASETKTDVMMTSQVLRKLENRGYVKRKSHETDSRAKKIQLTKKGSDILEEAMKVLEDVDSEFFQKAPKDTEKFSSGLTVLLSED